MTLSSSTSDATLAEPDLLPGWQVRVGEIFEFTLVGRMHRNGDASRACDMLRHYRNHRPAWKAIELTPVASTMPQIRSTTVTIHGQFRTVAMFVKS